MPNVKLLKCDDIFPGPKKAMVLAAGLGTRMRPLTNTTPKPLIVVRGKPLLDHALDSLERVGIEEVVVNVHHLADQIEEHVRSRADMKIRISDERERLLDSGGGVAKALPMLGDDPFYLLNADSFWVEGFKPNLARMADFFNPDYMDMLLLLAGTANSIGFDSSGDFNMDPNGKLQRRAESRIAPFVYAGATILKPSIFEKAPSGAFSLNKQFDHALERERLFGLRLEGLWLHVGTPEAVVLAEAAIARSAA